MTSEPLPWQHLPESAQKAVADLIVLLAGRFTGRVEFECAEGGVREMRESRIRRGGDLGKLARP